MIYCISDLHGEYEKYISLLKEINFSDGDTLYVLGDIVDRGARPMKILTDMMQRPNVVPLSGNHEAAAAYILNIFSQGITEELIETLDENTLSLLRSWMSDGGEATLKDFLQYSAEEREKIVNYLKTFHLYEEVSAGENEYLLVHGGLEKFSSEKALSDYSPCEMLFFRTDYSRPIFSGNKYLVTGHTPTMEIPENPKPGYIYRADNHIAIDCGAVFRGGRLGAICLDTGEEFYSN